MDENIDNIAQTFFLLLIVCSFISDTHYVIKERNPKLDYIYDSIEALFIYSFTENKNKRVVIEYDEEIKKDKEEQEVKEVKEVKKEDIKEDIIKEEVKEKEIIKEEVKEKEVIKEDIKVQVKKDIIKKEEVKKELIKKRKKKKDDKIIKINKKI